MLRAAMGPSSGDTTVLIRNLVNQFRSTLHTRQSSIQKNKYQVSHKHCCTSWWWAHSSPKHAEIDKYKHTKKKIVHQVGLFTRSFIVYKQENNFKTL